LWQSVIASRLQAKLRQIGETHRAATTASSQTKREVQPPVLLTVEDVTVCRIKSRKEAEDIVDFEFV